MLQKVGPNFEVYLFETPCGMGLQREAASLPGGVVVVRDFCHLELILVKTFFLICISLLTHVTLVFFPSSVFESLEVKSILG